MAHLHTILSLMPKSAGSCLWDSFVPPALREDAELLRRARLQIRFGWMGVIFGILYAAFYFAIGHPWGGAIIVLCSVLVGLVPCMVRMGKSLALTGNFYACVLVLGFAGLCRIEGGLHGHAIAWLAAIPLCSLLLVDLRGALIWSGLCIFTVLGFGVAGCIGITFPELYPHGWDSILSTAGYAGLVVFMTVLGIIFERTRARAVKQTEEVLARLTEANRRLSRLNQEKDEFMNIAAHDLKNPLCAISGHAQLLEIFGIQSEEQVLETAVTIRRQAQRMLDIITNLLDVRKIEEGRMSLKLECCDAAELLGEVVDDYRQRASQKEIDLQLRGTGDTAVKADRTAVRQILDNLVSNAIKYSPPGTSVRCVVVPEEGCLSLEIIDEGPGLSEADQLKMFQKFTRLTPVPTGGETSNGLGLWIVHRMASAMNGEVRCRSQLGSGSTFVLRLPRWPTTTQTGTEEQGVERNPVGKPVTAAAMSRG